MNLTRQIILAIEEYKADLTKYPIFFKAADLDYLETENALENILSKIENPQYFAEIAAQYTIPYDIVSARVVKHLDVDDTIVRYVVSKFIDSKVKKYKHVIDPDSFSSYCVVDIFDCYNEIDPQIFVSTLLKEFGSKFPNQKDKDLLNKIVNVRNRFSESFSGFLIGSKPDENFVEIFLSILHSRINLEVSENISRINDEFIIFANSIGELRKIATLVEEFLGNHKLRFNKAKNITNITCQVRKITRLIPRVKVYPYTSPSCPPPPEPEIEYFELNYTVQHNITKTINSEIKTYDDSIIFLQEASAQMDKVRAFLNKYPEYNLTPYWTSSTPVETKQIHKEIDFTFILDPRVISKLEVILYQFPKSQYYSALAINLLTIYATQFKYDCASRLPNDKQTPFVTEGIEITEINETVSTFLCEKANSILLNAIRSENIYDYQKYLIARELYFNKQDLTVDPSNFKIKGNAPFEVLMSREIKKLQENINEIPLNTIINDLSDENVALRRYI